MDPTGGWTDEHVFALGDPVAIATLADAGHWRSVGCDDAAVWGVCLGADLRATDRTYEVVVDLSPVDVRRVDARPTSPSNAVRARCTCPSRKHPCKHALALLLRYARGDVPTAVRPAAVDRTLVAMRPAPSAGAGPTGSDRRPAPRPSDAETDRSDRPPDERTVRAAAGLADLGRWLEDRMRTGLADPVVARYETWDGLAARLVDAGAGALAGRVRRIAGLVGVGPDWHERVLAEIGILHLLVAGGLRLPALPDDLADALAVAIGRQVRRADVLGGVPETDDWFVAGRSDAREDRIVVRRWWLHGRTSGRWAMVLSFAAHGEALDDDFVVGETIRVDVHRYPGRSMRVLVSPLDDATPVEDPHTGGSLRVPSGTVAEACASIGAAVATEPWIERVPATLVAAPAPSPGGWCLTDATGSLPLVGTERSIAILLAASRGRPVSTTIEWTPWGVRPVAVHLADRSIDIGPRAGAVGGPENGVSAVSRPMTELDGYWQQLLAAAVLGTERRDPPTPPIGALGDLLADASVERPLDRPSDAAARLLVAVAATTAVRRGAFRASPPAELLAAPDRDDRRWCSPEAASTWRTIVRDWPILEDEWLDAVTGHGLALPPDLVVGLLERHRTDALRRGRVVEAAGPLAPWLADHVPALAGSRVRRSGSGSGVAEARMPADLAPLVTASRATLVGGLEALLTVPSGPSSRGPFLARLLARCRADALADVAGVLDRVGHPLVELVDLRRRMLAELVRSAISGSVASGR